MKRSISRREFLAATGAAAVTLSPLGLGVRRAFGQAGALSAGVPVQGVAPIAPKATMVLELFDYEGVTLGASRWLKQYEAAREFYLSIPDDDTLKGYREAAGLPAPGNHLGGWASRSSAGIFGQWLQAMARGYHSTGDTALRDKAVRLVEGYAKTVGPDGACHMNSTYPYEKLIGGLIDMDRYMNYRGARDLLDRIINWGIANLDRTRRAPSNRGLGQPTEWYTVSENSYRAYQWMADEKYRNFAELWHYNKYWDKFIDTSHPDNIAGLHAYSHVNTLSSAAKTYEVTGDEKYLMIIKNAFDWLQRDECYATGGFGPDEFMMPPGGALGKSLETSVETFETPCGSWAGFKLSKYLMQFTGEAKYGDWIEKLLYNGIGSALGMDKGGKTFYYSNYNLASGGKGYYVDAYPCCAGTYFQDVVEFHNLIYLRDATALYVNLYVPSQLAWNHGDNVVKVTQQTDYPVADTSTIKLEMTHDQEFPLKFRVPAWSRGVTFKVNGAAVQAQARPGSWATIQRTWKSGDTVEIRIPLTFATPPIDPQHPTRVAVMRGPLVLAQQAPAGSAMPTVPAADEIEKWLTPGDQAGEFRVAGAGGAGNGMFRPFYTYAKDEPYRIYFDPQYKPGPVETGRG